MIQPIQYAIYKGMGGKFGAAQFNLQAAHKYCPKCKKRDFTGTAVECSEDKEKFLTREGAVFLEVTSAKDKNVYDWERKVTIALSVNDISKLLYGIRTAQAGTEIKLMHDPGAKSDKQGKVQKHLSLTSPQGPGVGFMLNVAEFSAQEKRIHTVPLSPDEALAVTTLLQSALVKILGWA